MTASLVTRGLIAGGSADGTAPSIANMTPSPSVEPGEPGGFPASFSAARVTPIEFDVVDLDPGLQLVVITCKFTEESADEDGPTQVVHNGTAFCWPFDSDDADRSAITDGYHYVVLPRGGWPPGKQARFHVYAVDAAGNLEGGLP